MGKFAIAMILWTAAGAEAAMAQGLPPESVTVTGTRQQTITSFLKAVVTPTHMTGKIARWETPICPAVLGLDAADAAPVIARVKETALAAGARINNRADCKTNIEIVFTDAPQLTLDNVKETVPELLGYHSSAEQRDKLAVVIRPIQAWYTTATQDLKGVQEIDSPRTTKAGPGVIMVLPCDLLGRDRMPGMGPGGINKAPIGKLCRQDLAYATKASVAGSRIADGLRSAFYHIIITVDSGKMNGRSGVNDYVAMLALTELSSLDRCQDMPSIVNMLPTACEQSADTLTPGDLGYLRGLYGMNADKLARGQQNEIASQMEKAMLGQ